MPEGAVMRSLGLLLLLLLVATVSGTVALNAGATNQTPTSAGTRDVERNNYPPPELALLLGLVLTGAMALPEAPDTGDPALSESEGPAGGRVTLRARRRWPCGRILRGGGRRTPRFRPGCFTFVSVKPQKRPGADGKSPFVALLQNQGWAV
ncbi:hypothetical protein JRQ81_018366 [Phrynocephalus forsythii]|uniref:Uncharacterized protein n=1 Tax=Phrynocephalus forsythii TaxID=171643 RepID=A0A9Q0XQF2_9SAUR|nr:hypothetical protein JRQ81_018366 [Phrynocephalus forsythii]